MKIPRLDQTDMPGAFAPDVFMDALATDLPPLELWRITQGYLAEKGFDRIILLSVPGAGGQADIRTNMPEQFLQTYRDEGFAADDPFIQYCLPSRISISTGIAYLDDYDYLTNRAGDLIELAATAGFRAGFSVTTVRPGQAGAEGWNIGSSLSRKEVEAIRKHHGRDITLGLLALRGRLTGPRHRLTPRETDAMHLLVSGCRTKEIAARMGISDVTVEFHLANARRKLGAPTREAAVARFLKP